MTQLNVPRSLVHQLLYGELLALALPVVKAYWSDLYHDAHWLAGEIDASSDGCEFVFGVRTNGTLIGVDEVLIAKHSEHAYRVVLLPHPHYQNTFLVTITAVKCTGE